MRRARFVLRALAAAGLGAALATAAVAAFAHPSRGALLPNESYAPVGPHRAVLSAVSAKGLHPGGHGARAAGAAAGHNLPCTAADTPTNFDIFSLGNKVEGFVHNQTLRRCDSPGLYRANYVSMTYGDCTAPPGSDSDGCALPLEIQSWPACERGAETGSFPLTPPGADKWRHIRGVPAKVFADGHVELYTGTTTIVIFGTSNARVLAAAAAVQPMGRRSMYGANAHLRAPSSRADLPAPAAAAMDGSLTCSDD